MVSIGFKKPIKLKYSLLIYIQNRYLHLSPFSCQNYHFYLFCFFIYFKCNHRLFPSNLLCFIIQTYSPISRFCLNFSIFWLVCFSSICGLVCICVLDPLDHMSKLPTLNLLWPSPSQTSCQTALNILNMILNQP